MTETAIESEAFVTETETVTEIALIVEIAVKISTFAEAVQHPGDKYSSPSIE